MLDVTSSKIYVIMEGFEECFKSVFSHNLFGKAWESAQVNLQPKLLNLTLLLHTPFAIISTSQKSGVRTFSQCLCYHLSTGHRRKHFTEDGFGFGMCGRFGNVNRIRYAAELLAGRSPYFKDLFSGEMIESTSSSSVELPTVSSPGSSSVIDCTNSSVELTTVSSSVLILVMKFLYTGKLISRDFGSSTSRALGNDRFQPDWNFVGRAVAAARIFMLDQLEKVLIEQLQKDVTREVCLGEEDSLTQLAERFSILHEYRPTLWAEGIEGNSIEALSRSMAKALANHDLSPATLSNLSEAAFCSVIEKAMEASSDVDSSEIRASLLDDYLRLRQILTWCTVSRSNGLGDFGHLDRTCLPGAEMAIDFIDPIDDESTRPEFDFSRGRESFIDKIAKGPLKRLLSYVDFTCIPTGLLCSVIEPLEIIESGEFVEVLRTQAMRNSTLVRGAMDAPLPNLWHVKGTDESIHNVWRIPVGIDSIFRFTVRRETDTLTVCAVAGLLMSTSKPLRWDIRMTPRGALEQETMAGFEFGFIALDDCEDTFDDLSGPLSADSRCSGIRMGCGVKTVVGFYNGAETRRWTLGANEFGWRESVILSVKDDLSMASKPSSKISYLAGSRKFNFVAAKEKLIYPAVYFSIRASGQSRFRPHLDQLSVGIYPSSWSNLVMVKSTVELGS
ncbi:hypothetical protein R1sor_015645 [Riccia sorocarpa]|uniref:BTB domain-containing protein n=1 Tax=Riccia sorocarpa TaxID=122646 RepID=A0ABD3HGZ0_9MARC